MIANKIPSFPQNFSCFRIDGSSSRRAEGNINIAALDDWCGRCITVELVCELRLLHVKQSEVLNDFSCLAIDANGEQSCSVFGRCGQPDLVIPNDGRRPGTI